MLHKIFFNPNQEELNEILLECGIFDFSGCDLCNLSFNYAHLQFAMFDGANLKGSTFKYAHLNGASFNGAKVDACFHGANLDWSTFYNAEGFNDRNC